MIEYPHKVEINCAISNQATIYVKIDGLLVLAVRAVFFGLPRTENGGDKSTTIEGMTFIRNGFAFS